MAETTTPVNLLFKYGDLSVLNNENFSITNGTIYFAKDNINNNNTGYIIYGDPVETNLIRINGNGYSINSDNILVFDNNTVKFNDSTAYITGNSDNQLILNDLIISKNNSLTESDYKSQIYILSDLKIKGKIDDVRCIEIGRDRNGSTNEDFGYIDFHFNDNESTLSNDYTSRIIEKKAGILSINNVKISSINDGEIYYIGNNTINLALSSSALYISNAENDGQINLGLSTTNEKRRWKNIYCTGIIYFNNGYIRYQEYLNQDDDGETTQKNVVRFSNGSKALSLHDESLYIAGFANDGVVNLGSGQRRWNQAYLFKGPIDGSDIRLKDVQDSIYLENLIKMYDSINPIAYKWKNDKETDKHNRIHVGLSSQEVEEKMFENKLTRLDFGGLCVDPVYDNNGNQIDESYGLRYDEFHGLHILKNHQQDERITELENQIANLKTQLELLKLSIGG